MNDAQLCLFIIGVLIAGWITTMILLIREAHRDKVMTRGKKIEK